MVQKGKRLEGKKEIRGKYKRVIQKKEYLVNLKKKTEEEIGGKQKREDKRGGKGKGGKGKGKKKGGVDIRKEM